MTLNFSYTFLPFGQGPRGCIAPRFAFFLVKASLVAMVRKYRLIRTRNTPRTITFDPKANATQCLHPIWVRVEKR